MNTNGLRCDPHFPAVAGYDKRALHDSQGLARGIGGIADEGILKLTRTQRSVRFIAPVRERFCRDTKSRFPKYSQQG